jgi:DNA-binding MarR family transcriptional regulator
LVARRQSPHLTMTELEAWRGFLTVHARIVEQLTASLEKDFRLTLREFEAMIMLAASPAGRLQIGSLASRVLLTPSGVSRLVDRLAQRGLFERCADDGDGRAAPVQLTPAGRALLVEADKIHARDVRALFLSKLSAKEQAGLALTWQRMGVDMSEWSADRWPPQLP